MVRRPPRPSSRVGGAPHACGDGPERKRTVELTVACSPRTWGWSVSAVAVDPALPVLPTHVGMVRSDCSSRSSDCCAPHARGDGPQRLLVEEQRLLCSPRTWGWSVTRASVVRGRSVLPTHVGMVRSRRRARRRRRCAPHARGDGPPPHFLRAPIDKCSPRTWGWSALADRAVGDGGVLPTHVGMVRPATSPGPPGRGAPHARGDGPAARRKIRAWQACSPRTWGWSLLAHRTGLKPNVLSAHAGRSRLHEPAVAALLVLSAYAGCGCGLFSPVRLSVFRCGWGG